MELSPMRLASAYTNAAMVPAHSRPLHAWGRLTPATRQLHGSMSYASGGTHWAPRAQNITLPANVTWSDISVLAVWCEQVRAARCR